MLFILHGLRKHGAGYRVERVYASSDGVIFGIPPYAKVLSKLPVFHKMDTCQETVEKYAARKSQALTAQYDGYASHPHAWRRHVRPQPHACASLNCRSPVNWIGRCTGVSYSLTEPRITVGAIPPEPHIIASHHVFTYLNALPGEGLYGCQTSG